MWEVWPNGHIKQVKDITSLRGKTHMQTNDGIIAQDLVQCTPNYMSSTNHFCLLSCDRYLWSIRYKNLWKTSGWRIDHGFIILSFEEISATWFHIIFLIINVYYALMQLFKDMHLPYNPHWSPKHTSFTLYPLIYTIILFWLIPTIRHTKAAFKFILLNKTVCS